MPNLGCLLLTGERCNALTGATLSSSSASPLSHLASLEALRDSRANAAFRFASPPGAVEWVEADVRRLVNGGFEQWSGGGPTGWTVYTTGGASVTQETSVVYAGAAALALEKAAPGDTVLVQQTTIARAGDRLRITWALRGSGAMPVGLQVVNRRTGRYLAADGTWGASANVALQVSGHYAPGTLTFEVEPYTTVRDDVCELLVQVYGGAGSGKVFADAIELLPVLDFVSIHGHNIDPGVAVDLVGSNDGFASEETPVVPLHAYLPACYARFTEAVYTHWRLRFSGTNNAPIWLGEWVLGRPVTTRAPRPGMKVRHHARQVQHETPAGGRTRYNRTILAERVVDLGWQLLSADQAAQMRQELFDRTRGGRLPFVLVPWLDLALASPPAAARLVMLGSIDPDLDVTWSGPREYRVDVTVAEAAFPAVDELL